MLSLGPASLRAAESRVYHVGNSLSLQTAGDDRLKNLAAPRGIDITYGFHIRCGEGMSYIWANPTDTCVDPNGFGRFADALPNNPWDIVTLQTYGDDLGAARQSIANMVNLTRTNAANSNTKFYVFTGWPQHLSASATPDYSDHWLQTYDRAEPPTYDNRLRKWTRDYSNELMAQLRDDAAGLPVDIYRIDTGEVFYQLDLLAQQGQLGATTNIEQWYSDDFHMGEFGRYASSITMLAALYGQSPVGLPAPVGMDPGVATAVQQTAWNVVSADSYSSVPEPGAALLFALLAPAAMRRTRRTRRR
jgi:hypothetical protein